MVEPNDGRPGGAHHIRIENKDKKFNWLPWLLAALALLALLLALSRCDREEDTAVAPAAPAPSETAPAELVATTPNAGQAAALAGTAGLGTYLAGTDAAPRNFVFEKINFETGKSNIRPTDAAEINDVAAALKQHPNARVRIAGYADPRGSAAANASLGKARADSIKAALVAQGIDAGRIETTTGGESDPVDSNATASGRLENRRTELIVTAR